MTRATVLGFLTILTLVLMVLFQSSPSSQQYAMLEVEGESIVFSPYTVWREGFPLFPKERITDPVNVIFLNTTIEDIETILYENGWMPIVASSQFLYIGHARVKNGSQLIHPGKNEKQRYHVRLFSYKNLVFGAVHLEAGHALISWEEAEYFLARTFTDVKQHKGKAITKVAFRNTENDGHATFINLASTK